MIVLVCIFYTHVHIIVYHDIYLQKSMYILVVINRKYSVCFIVFIVLHYMLYMFKCPLKKPGGNGGWSEARAE